MNHIDSMKANMNTRQHQSSSSLAIAPPVHSYQNVREQLIALSVDLEDRYRVLKSLQGRIDKERVMLNRVEADLAEEYDVIIEMETNSYKENTDKILKQSNILMNEKKQLLESCQMLLDQLKENEHSLAEQSRSIQHDVDQLIEQDRKIFKAGAEERLEKFLALKSLEYKEATSKALQPEINRLQHAHEREMAQVIAHYQQEERRVKEANAVRLQDLVEQERQAILESQRSAVKEHMDTLVTELEAAEREHRFRMNSIKEDLEKDLQKLKDALMNKTNKERKHVQAEIHAAQENYKQRSIDLRSRHHDEIIILKKDHEETMKGIRRRLEQAKADIEGKYNKHLQGDPGLGLTKEGGAPVSTYIDTEAKVERDRRLQAEIRQLQAETIRYERAWKAAADAERNEIVEMRVREEKESQRRQRQLTEEIAALAMSREQVASETKDVVSRNTALDEEINELTKETRIYEDGIAAHRMRMKDMEAMMRMRERDLVQSADKRTVDLRARVEKLTGAIRDLEEQSRVDRERQEESHRQALEAMDRQIKAEVAQREEDLECLRDAVHAGKVKLAKLEKLLVQYSKA